VTVAAIAFAGVAQDLSNLPPGETAIDPETGEEFTKN
jgi:hypothetical protein